MQSLCITYEIRSGAPIAEWAIFTAHVDKGYFRTERQAIAAAVKFAEADAYNGVQAEVYIIHPDGHRTLLWPQK